MTLDSGYRATLTAKYGIDRPPMDPVQNSTVQTINRTERLEVQAFPSRGTDDYNAYLFDPSRLPRLYAIAADAHRAMKLCIADGTIECLATDDDELQVYVVGDDRVRTCKPGRPADRLAGFLRILDAIHTEDASYECNVAIAEDCHRLGGGTTLLPLLYGGVLLVFEICASCHSAAREVSTLGYRVGEIDAHERARASAPVQSARKTPPRAETCWEQVRRWLRGAS